MADLELTDKQKLVALELYLRLIKTTADDLRAKVTKDMGDNDDERVGAKLPDGTKIGTVTYSEGRRSARVTDEAALLAWCKRVHPSEVQTVEIVRPAYLTLLLSLAKADDAPAGAHGVDPETGEELDFIEVQQGQPFVSVTSTKEGIARMSALASGFPRMLERPTAATP